MFVTSPSGTVTGYTTSGGVLSPPLSLLLSGASGIAASGGDLFIESGSNVVEYNTSGTLLNSSFITGLSMPLGIAVITPEPSAWITFAIGALILLGFRCWRRPAFPQA